MFLKGFVKYHLVALNVTERAEPCIVWYMAEPCPKTEL
ncbi:hypothetical protein BMS3Abin10_01890 [bacterium BMS3Abin10]|nr:hypothetical protein BMS3Abin10_01890 [bacterium BMS3Abin10]GBE38256.1 hypothetical protein BMS3Bbin08_00859 [bacterium BMS3Bbin08]